MRVNKRGSLLQTLVHLLQNGHHTTSALPALENRLKKAALTLTRSTALWASCSAARAGSGRDAIRQTRSQACCAWCGPRTEATSGRRASTACTQWGIDGDDACSWQ
jgi:hypothetical protein